MCDPLGGIRTTNLNPIENQQTQPAPTQVTPGQVCQLGPHELRQVPKSSKTNARVLMEHFVPRLGTGRASGGWMAVSQKVLKNPELKKAFRALSLDERKAVVGQYRKELKSTAQLLSQDDAFSKLGGDELKSIAEDVLKNVLRRLPPPPKEPKDEIASQDDNPTILQKPRARSKPNVNPQPQSAKRPPIDEPPSAKQRAQSQPPKVPVSKSRTSLIGRLVNRLKSIGTKPASNKQSGSDINKQALGAYKEKQQVEEEFDQNEFNATMSQVNSLKKELSSLNAQAHRDAKTLQALTKDQWSSEQRADFTQKKLAIANKYARKFLPGQSYFSAIKTKAGLKRSSKIDEATAKRYETAFNKSIEDQIAANPFKMPNIQATAVQALKQAVRG